MAIPVPACSIAMLRSDCPTGHMQDTHVSGEGVWKTLLLRSPTALSSH